MLSKHDNMLGESAALADALDHLSQLAPISRPVLVLGERGTGKELAAERLHYLSQRWDGPFVKVNCAAMAESLLESELFGHEAGAFTGASRQHIGRFERADGGTLLLDEIGTTSPRLQEKLLRLIEYGEFERLGGQRTLRVDVRVVGATNADLPEMVAASEFRADLLDRLSFDVVHMPALRHRGRDVIVLAEHFALKMSAELGWSLFPGFSEEAVQALLAYDWPGNVRELRNVVERSLHRWDNEHDAVKSLVIDPFASPHGDAPAASGNPDTATTGTREAEPGVASPDHERLPFREAVLARERELLETALERCAWHQGRSAEYLGLSYDQLRGLLKKHALTKRSRAST